MGICIGEEMQDGKVRRAVLSEFLFFYIVIWMPFFVSFWNFLCFNTFKSQNYAILHNVQEICDKIILRPLPFSITISSIMTIDSAHVGFFWTNVMLSIHASSGWMKFINKK